MIYPEEHVTDFIFFHFPKRKGFSSFKTFFSSPLIYRCQGLSHRTSNTLNFYSFPCFLSCPRFSISLHVLTQCSPPSKLRILISHAFLHIWLHFIFYVSVMNRNPYTISYNLLSIYVTNVNSQNLVESQYFLGDYYITGFVLSALHVLIDLILIILWVGTTTISSLDEKTNEQRDQVTCPKLGNKWWSWVRNLVSLQSALELENLFSTCVSPLHLHYCYNSQYFLIPDVFWVFLHQTILWHHLGVLQFNSIIYLEIVQVVTCASLTDQL